MDANAIGVIAEGWFNNLALSEQVGLVASTAYEFYPSSSVAVPALLAAEEELLEHESFITEHGFENMSSVPVTPATRSKTDPKRKRDRDDTQKATPDPRGSKTARQPNRGSYGLVQLDSVPVGPGPSYLSGPIWTN